MDIDFERLNILVGTAKGLEQKDLLPDDLKLFNRDFDLLVKELAKIDVELGANLAAEKEFYTGVCQIAKGYFDKGFGGLKCATGQYGMALIYPQLLKDAASGTQTNYHSWRRTVVTESGRTRGDILGGAVGGTWVYAEATAEKKTVLAFHTLISYIPDPKLVLIELNVNDYPYVPWSVEPYAKVIKPNQLFKLIPLPGRPIVHPGGRFNITGWFDLQLKTVPILTSNIDVELAPFGLAFAEYGQLVSSNLI